jgi:hypothetical protein
MMTIEYNTDWHIDGHFILKVQHRSEYTSRNLDHHVRVGLWGSQESSNGDQKTETLWYVLLISAIATSAHHMDR